MAGFSEMTKRWLAKCPSIKRLAFGAVLLHPTADPKSSYEVLDRYLPDVRVSPSSSEFMYKINRTRMSRVLQELKINRLSTWSALHWTLSITLGLSAGATTRELAPTQGDACKLELDISTDAEFSQQLPTDKLGALWDELIQIGIEIAEKGDVP